MPTPTPRPSGPSDIVIDVQQLVKRFKAVTAVDGISFSVRRSACVGLLGPNGAGKTSTVRVIECISPGDEGLVRVLGMAASLGARAVRARLGVVPQENDLDVDLTVLQNLRIFACFYGLPRRTANERIQSLLEFMELAAKRDRRIEELSGGMKRRLLIARALLNAPEILVLDEPTTGLDPQVRHLIWQRLRALKEQGLSILLTTHSMDEAQELCDDVVILDHGKILRQGAPLALIAELVGEEVVEVRGWRAREEIEALLAGIAFHAELHGDTIIFSRGQLQAVMARLAAERRYRVLRRPATLEDVFLKLTGRGLDEER
jgi:lipooligosaccharide transport system ATP-binding protein